MRGVTAKDLKLSVPYHLPLIPLIWIVYQKYIVAEVYNVKGWSGGNMGPSPLGHWINASVACVSMQSLYILMTCHFISGLPLRRSEPAQEKFSNSNHKYKH